MKKILLLLLLSGSLAYGQKCKYKRDEVDEFTKHRILETKDNPLTISWTSSFSCTYNLLNIDDKRYLVLNAYGPSAFTLREGAEVLFKTDAEEPIRLAFPKTVISGSGYNSSLKNIYFTASQMIPLPDEAYSRLLKEGITKLRVYTGQGYADDEVKPKHDKKLKEMLKCIE
ncbi:hypothetical protein ABH942_000256 [Flavobacterium sp. 28YEA47A]|uniref:hypothetical protein n=1 Tax=Flavobacterium sp. 28YEA47A TaxID=3156276 RepID=UPI0035156353